MEIPHWRKDRSERNGLKNGLKTRYLDHRDRISDCDSDAGKEATDTFVDSSYGRCVHEILGIPHLILSPRINNLGVRIVLADSGSASSN